MNLGKLFEMQKVLDDRILDEHPELKGQDNLDWKVLALQVELGECANEWRGFKKWSNDQEPRTSVILVSCDLCGEKSDYPYEVEGITETKKTLLEEYVDCLHFILSIGNNINFEVWEKYNASRMIRTEELTNQFNWLFDKVGDFSRYKTVGSYQVIFDLFIGLGAMLGFDWEQIEQAYISKNQINQIRQDNSY